MFRITATAHKKNPSFGARGADLETITLDVETEQQARVKADTIGRMFAAQYEMGAAGASISGYRQGSFGFARGSVSYAIEELDETPQADDAAAAPAQALRWNETTAAGNTYEFVAYVDPMPGRKGREVVEETCGKCSGAGVVGYGNVTLRVGKREDRFCFDCGGHGVTTRFVSSVRATARRQAAADNEARAAAADYAATADQRAADELAADWDAALLEQARRAALVQGFVAPVGERFRNLACEVVTNYQFDSEDHFGRPTTKSLMIFRRSDNGQLLKWVTGCRGENAGQLVSLTATVKAHDSYQGQDQTVITRAVVK